MSMPMPPNWLSTRALEAANLFAADIAGIGIELAEHPFDRRFHQFAAVDRLDVVAFDLVERVDKRLKKFEIFVVGRIGRRRAGGGWPVGLGRLGIGGWLICGGLFVCRLLGGRLIRSGLFGGRLFRRGRLRGRRPGPRGPRTRCRESHSSRRRSTEGPRRSPVKSTPECFDQPAWTGSFVGSCVSGVGAPE